MSLLAAASRVCLTVGIGFTIASCTGAPNCGNTLSQDTAVEILENSPLFVASVKRDRSGIANPHSNNFSGISEVENLTQRISVLEQDLATKREGCTIECAAREIEYGVPEMSPKQLELQSIEESIERLESQLSVAKNRAVDSAWDLAYRSREYSWSNVRMTDRNSTTNAVECVGELNVIVPDWGQGRAQVAFGVEETVDGEHVVTVYN